MGIVEAVRWHNFAEVRGMFKDADPVDGYVIEIEQQNLTQRDLIPQFGSESAVSMFLAGQRNLTIEQVRNLSTRFKLPTDVFIPKGGRRSKSLIQQNKRVP